MIRIFEYNIPENYKDFENYLFTNLSPTCVDIINDKLTIDSVDYRISSLMKINEQNQMEHPIVNIDFNDFIIKVWLSELNAFTRYRFVTDLIEYEKTYTFLSVSNNSTTGDNGIDIFTSHDGRVLLSHISEDNSHIITEIPVIFTASSSQDAYIKEPGDDIILRT